MSDPDGLDTKMRTADAASMLRKAVKKNMKPYDKTAIELNNDRVDAWKEQVLDRVAVNGMIDASMVWASWQHFEEGCAIREMMKLVKEGHITLPDEDQVNYWRNYLIKCSVEDLHALGSATVSTVWTLLTNYARFWYAQQKYKRIFGESDSPLQWEKLRTKERELAEGEAFQLWDDEQREDVNDKVRAVLMNQVHPEGMSGIRG